MTLADRRVLVTGGTGFIGGRLVERLVLEHDAEVRVLVRNFSHASRIARFDLHMVAGDIRDAVAIDAATEGCDIVFHCAYDFTGTRRQREQVNVGGTENVARAALRHGARLVHVSTVDVYGWPAEGDLDEMTPRQAAGNIYAETKLAAEQLVLDYHRRFGLPVTVVQPTIVYGPFSRPWTITPVRQLKSGQVVLVDGGGGCCNAVYVDDVVEGLLLAAASEEAIGETFLISGAEPVTWQDFYSAYEQMLGLRATASLSMKEVNQFLRRQGRGGGTLHELVSVLRDPQVRARVAQVRLMGRLREVARDYLPERFRKSLKAKMLGSDARTGESIEEPAVTEGPVCLPDEWKLRLYRSRARVRIDKARQMLGYEPRFDLERGMELTAHFVRWANLV